MKFLKVPLHKLHLTSELVNGKATVPGVTFIMANDLVQGGVWGTSKFVPPTIVAPPPDVRCF